MYRNEKSVLTILLVNDNPVAVNDVMTVMQNASATDKAVLSNDYDADGNTLTISSITQPTHGTAAITHSNTQVSYTPTVGYIGADIFTYTVSDGNGGSATATVSVTVSATSTAPVVPGKKNGKGVTGCERGQQQTITTNNINITLPKFVLKHTYNNTIKQQ